MHPTQDKQPPNSQEWQRAADDDPSLRTRRRAYDCELILQHHRNNTTTAYAATLAFHDSTNTSRSIAAAAADHAVPFSRNHAALAVAWRAFRARVNRQRRARAWFAAAEERREVRLKHMALHALARARRRQAAETAAISVRSRAGLMTWRQAVASSRAERAASGFLAKRLRCSGARGLRRWRRRAMAASGRGEHFELGLGMGRGSSGTWQGGEELQEDRHGLERRIELFRQRRAKRVVLRRWRDAVTAGGMAELAGAAAKTELGLGGKMRKRRRPRQRRGDPPNWVVSEREMGTVEHNIRLHEGVKDLAVPRGQGPRLRTAEVRSTFSRLLLVVCC